MAEPKKKQSRSRRGKRKSHLALVAPQINFCPKCKKLKKPHTVCQNCENYGDKKI